MRFDDVTDSGPLSEGTAELKNWFSTIGRKTWNRIRHPLKPVVNRGAPAPIPLSIPILSDSNAQPMAAGDHGGTAHPDASGLLNYLLGRENCTNDIIKLNDILKMPQVLLEIGCGTAEAARQIALKNPAIGVIGTDLYDWSHQQSDGACYGRTARLWHDRRLPAQMDTPANLVILRAEADLLRCLPLRTIDSILLINPEPSVGKSFLGLLQGESLFLKIKHGPLQIVILPYSRELGVMACGDCSFDHDPDWSRGLGFMMGSGLRFSRGGPVQWGVDLTNISAYTGNSTQRDVYVYGKQPDGPFHFPIGQDISHMRQ
jgi:hypothetical protein